MSRTCPHCKHLRPADADCPEWQCPACEKAYNKGPGAPVNEQYASYATSVSESRSSGFAPWLMMLVLFGGGVWAGGYWQRDAGAEQASIQTRKHPMVLLYATEPGCGYCAAAREFFKANGISYTELDIEKSSANHDEHRRLGGQGVPLIVVGQEVVGGYNEDRLRSLLWPWRKAG